MTESNSVQNKTMFRLMLFTMGLVAFALATLCILSPDTVTDTLGLDSETTEILGYALYAVGLSDIAIALIMFKQRDRK